MSSTPTKAPSWQQSPGSRIVLADLIGTAIFTASAVLAAVVFDGLARAQGVAIALGLFALGTAAFLWGWWTAVQRSRTEQMAVAELYLLMGAAIPRSVARTMNAALTVQVVVALATAFARSSTDGKPGSTLAFGVLVPMFGLGLNGLWAARHGAFGPRLRREGAPAGDRPVDQHDDEHGAERGGERTGDAPAATADRMPADGPPVD